MNTLKVIGFGILGIIVVYVLWIAFVPMMFGEKIVERKVLEQSPQYIITQRAAILKIYPEYLQADDGVKTALKSQMCEIAGQIPTSEWPTEILNVCR